MGEDRRKTGRAVLDVTTAEAGQGKEDAAYCKSPLKGLWQRGAEGITGGSRK